NNSIIDCKITFNDGYAIRALNSNIVERNKIYFARIGGIDLSDFNIIKGNIVERTNTNQDINGAGIIVDTDNRVIENLLENNRGAGIRIIDNGNTLIGNEVFGTQSVSNIDVNGYTFLSSFNAWRNNIGRANVGGNVSTIQPPASRSLNNWMY
ncbi:MAG: right-handed parallel beta-helix repeat-containing protein, partial [Bacteroidota bacterium]